MTPPRPVRLVPEARREYLAAIDWYEDQRAGLGEAFVLAMDELLERLQPTGQWPVVEVRGGREIRRAVLRRFPYYVVFKELEDEVRVLAVAHKSRAPDFWLGRT